MVPATVAARRFLMTPAFAGVIRGAAFATAGLLISTGVTLMLPDGGTTWWQLAIGAAAIVLTYQGRLHPGLVVIGSALLGIALAR